MSVAEVVGIVMASLAIGGVVTSWLIRAWQGGRTVEKFVTHAQLDATRRDLEADIAKTEDGLQAHRLTNDTSHASIMTELTYMRRLLEEVRGDLKVIRRNGHGA